MRWLTFADSVSIQLCKFKKHTQMYILAYRLCAPEAAPEVENYKVLCY